MYKSKYMIAGFAAAMLFSSSMSFAGGQKTGINGAAFLKIGVGARQIGLGSAVTTLQNGGPNMMFWNPAGTSNLEGTALSLNHSSWLLSMDHNAFAFTHNVEGLGVIGIGLIHVGLGDIVANRDVAPTEALKPRQADLATGDVFSFYDMAANISLARQFSDKLSLGASVKFIKEKIDDQSATAIAGDFGVTYNTGWHQLVFGAALQNLGGDLTYYQSGTPLPLVFSIGASINIAEQEDNRVVALVDATKRQDSEQLYFGGMEVTLMDHYQLRGGYKFGLSGANDDFGQPSTDEGLSMGGGFVMETGSTKAHIDYSWTQFDILDSTHRFSLYFTF